jgi:alpha-glucoside transport system permease protein
LENYSSFVSDGDLIGTVWNSLLIAVPSTVLPVGLAAMSGYALAWGSFKGRNTLFLVIVALLVVPLHLALLPALELFGLLNVSGLPAVWLFHTAFGLPFAVFLMRNYFATLPPEILDAARVDGAGQARVFLTIALPLSKPALASLAVLQFIWTWNDLLVALIFSGQNRPFTVAIHQRLDEFGSGIGVITPGVVIGALIPIAVFLGLRRYFEAGIARGAMR